MEELPEFQVCPQEIFRLFRLFRVFRGFDSCVLGYRTMRSYSSYW